MKIAVIGSGQVGTALARALQRAGHEVKFGVKAPEAGRPDQVTVAEAARLAEVAILAVPFSAAADVVGAAPCFAGKIVIDATNPLGVGEDGLGLTMGLSTSGAEHTAALTPQARLFKTFNQTGRTRAPTQPVP